MPYPADLTRRNTTPLVPRGSALARLPRHVALWVSAQVATAAAAVGLGLWTSHPEIALTLCIAAGAALASPTRLWSAPLVATTVALTGLFFTLAEWPAVIGAGAAAGALVARTLPWPTDWLDSVNAGLGTLAGSSIGLFAATGLVPEALPAGLGILLSVAVVGLVGSAGLIPVAIRFDQHPNLPTRRQIRTTLKVAYRPPAFRALDLFGGCRKQSHDADTRQGLAEVTTWVYRLQITLQTLDKELDAVDASDIEARIERYQADDASDTFTRERRMATITHLERLLQHRDAIHIERGRTEALVDYALAFLEEARAGLAVARELPGEAIPDRLSEVLDRLRAQARDGDARRKTARELERMEPATASP